MGTGEPRRAYMVSPVGVMICTSCEPERGLWIPLVCVSLWQSVVIARPGGPEVEWRTGREGLGALVCTSCRASYGACGGLQRGRNVITCLSNVSPRTSRLVAAGCSCCLLPLLLLLLPAAC